MIRAPILDESALFLWSRIRDSNPPPTAWEAVALPDELTLRLPVYCSKGRRFCQQLFGSNPAGAVDFLLFGQRNGKKMDSPCKIQYNKTRRAFTSERNQNYGNRSHRRSFCGHQGLSSLHLHPRRTERRADGAGAVSYTHLTLPTTLSV